MKRISVLLWLVVLAAGSVWGATINVPADHATDGDTVLLARVQQTENANQQAKKINDLIEELGEGLPGDNNAATKALIQIGAKVIPYLLEVLQADPLPYQSRDLLNQNWVRLRSTHCLSQLNYGDIVKLLTKEIERDPHPSMQHIYAIYLTRHDLKQSIQVLVSNLKKDNYTFPDIIITLKNINSPFAIPMLKPLLTTDKPRLKLAAADILIHLGDTSGANLLLSQKEDEDLRLDTALLLSDEHLESILPILKNGLNHTEAKTRLKIINKLADLGQTNFIIPTKDKFLFLLDMLEQEPNAWERGTDLFLKEIPKPADEIIEMIGHPDGYDPSGTTKLRQAVVDRWRRRLNTEGIKWLKGLNPKKNCYWESKSHNRQNRNFKPRYRYGKLLLLDRTKRLLNRGNGWFVPTSRKIAWR